MESIIQIIRDRELFMQTYISLSDMYFLQRYTYKSEFYADYDRLLAYIHLYIPGEDRQFLVAACI
jgi:hypothetical protein